MDTKPSLWGCIRPLKLPSCYRQAVFIEIELVHVALILSVWFPFYELVNLQS